MNTTHFDRLIREITVTPTRRGFAGALAGLSLGGWLGAVRDPGTEAKKKKRKSCRLCQKRKKGKCKGNKPDDTACDGDGKCFAGECISRPTCLGFIDDCQESGECCSGVCIGGIFCNASNLDQPCLVQSDCSPVPGVLQCIAYRCRA